MTTLASSRPAAPAGSPMGIVLIVALVGLVASAAYVIGQLMAHGHTAYNGDSRGIFWGLPIVTYDFFLLSSTGLAMLASVWTVFRVEAYRPIARRALWLAVAALVGGVAALFLELGYPLRAMFMIPFSGATSAPLFWKVWGVIVYSLALLWLIVGWLLPGRDEPPRGAAVLALVAAVYITFVAGGVYGWMSMRPFWYGGEMSLAFLVESLLGAVTFVIIFTHLAHGFNADRLDEPTRTLFAGRLGGLFAILMIAHAFFVVSRLIAGLYANADGMQVWHHLWSRPMFQVELWVGLGLPIVLTAVPSLRRNLQLQLLAAVVAVVALFVARYDFVIGGQLVPLFKGSWVHGLLEYRPSAAEWAVLALSIFLSNTVNALGEKRLALDERA
ncbi:NrfD/PsrC family molybdoenzyme membrane anchor subunit [Tepidimonas ignava]|uniref:NrfD/PsrC family molybdoenzyme membrane anchor subunit n=1 Tax=Tepidimonas ignava TaxID=114249 RepID=UPI002FD9F7CC